MKMKNLRTYEEFVNTPAPAAAPAPVAPAATPTSGVAPVAPVAAGGSKPVQPTKPVQGTPEQEAQKELDIANAELAKVMSQIKQNEPVAESLLTESIWSDLFGKKIDGKVITDAKAKAETLSDEQKKTLVAEAQKNGVVDQNGDLNTDKVKDIVKKFDWAAAANEIKAKPDSAKIAEIIGRLLASIGCASIAVYAVPYVMSAMAGFWAPAIVGTLFSIPGFAVVVAGVVCAVLSVFYGYTAVATAMGR